MGVSNRRGFFDFDAKIRATGEFFKRFKSMSELPFKWNEIKSSVSDKMIRGYEDMLSKELKSNFAVPKVINSDFGELLNLDAAMDGIPECYRHSLKAKGVLKMGLNVSGAWNANENVDAIRCAAILAVFKLAKSRGQSVQIDVCYGSCGFGEYIFQRSHFRVSVPYPTPEIIKSIMTTEFRHDMIHNVVHPAGFSAGYRIWSLREQHPELIQEFDFILDRLETGDPKVEYARILEQIRKIA